MFLIRMLVSIFECILAVLMSGCVIYVTYRIFIKANPDFDMQAEIKRGNVAVGLLVSTIVICASVFVEKGMASAVQIFRVYMTLPAHASRPVWQLALVGLGHLVFSLLLAVLTISISLRLFGRLTAEMEEGKELEKGNLAVGLLLSSVVIVATFYVSGGLSALSRALVPQPSIGRIEIQK